MAVASQIIHLDSSFRNRLLYPNPADFVVSYVAPPSSQSMFSMMNPVSDEFPVYNFVFPLVPPYNGSINFTDSTAVPVPNSSLRIKIASWNALEIILDETDMLTVFGSSISQSEHNLLKNLYFVYGTTYPYTVVRIASYDSLTFTLRLRDRVELDLTIQDYCYLYNDSEVSSGSGSKILLMGALDTFRNLVRTTNIFVYNATRGEIIQANITTDREYLVSADSFTNWSVNDYYLLYNTDPYIRQLTAFPDGRYYSYAVKSLQLLESSDAFAPFQEFELYFTETSTLSGIRIKILRVDDLGKIQSFEIVERGFGVFLGRTYYVDDTSMSGYALSALFRVDESYQAFLVDGSISVSNNEFFTPFAMTTLYTHPHIFVKDEITYNVLPFSYTTYDEPYDASSYTQLQNQTGASMIYGMEYDTTNDKTYVYTTSYCEEMLQRLDDTYTNDWAKNVMFSTVQRDQYTPLNYTGSTVSQDQLVCYEVELLNLILPNLELSTTKVLTSFYPYLFVEFSNMTTSLSRNVNAIYTNNQYGQSALFAVPISDVNSPESSQFLNLDNSKSIQTIKFKPNDTFHFRVFLTNGETFTPFLKDTLPPLPPNPLVQISAVFSVRRLD